MKKKKEVQLHPGQWAALQSEARFVAMIAGTGSGKTWFGPKWLYREISNHPGKEWMVVAPTYKILEDASRKEFLNFFEGTELEGELKLQPNIYLLPDGGRVYFRSADKPHSIESVHLQGAWADEAGQYSRWAWVVLQSRVGLSEGKILISTTPYAENWLKLEFQDYARIDQFDENGNHITLEEGEEPETYHVIRFPSVLNPLYSMDEYKRMEKVLDPREFNMRYRGVFERMEGLVLPRFENCVTSGDPYKVHADDYRIGSVDPGMSDPFAALTAIYGDDGKLHFRRELYKSDMLLRDLLEFLDMDTTYYMDPAARREREELSALGLDVRPAVNDIRPGILKINEMIADERLVIPRDLFPNLRSEAATYKYKPKDDKPDKSTPHHLLDCLRYLVMGLEDDRQLDIYLL
jgi:phage terminase large subunit